MKSIQSRKKSLQKAYKDEKKASVRIRIVAENEYEPLPL